MRLHRSTLGATMLLGLALVPVAAMASGGHGGGTTEGTLGGIHLATEVLQIVLSLSALGAITLAGRAYGGKVGRGLMVGGVGIALFALQRMWHNLSEFGVLTEPAGLTSNGVFLVATLLMVVGYGLLYKTVADLHA
jgi:hypothetical protein